MGWLPDAWLAVEDLSRGTLTLILIMAIGWIARAFIRGDLITRAIHAETVEDRDYWRDHALRLDQQLDEIADGLRTTEKVVSALPANRDQGDENPS